MKRITNKIKKLDLISTLLNLLYILIAIVILLYLFSVMHVPIRDDWATMPHEHDYTLILGIGINQSIMNVIISLLVGFLIVSIPLTVSSFKRYLDKTIIDVDEWFYRNQYLLGTFELITLNPFSAFIRFYLARHTQIYVMDYGMKEGIIRTSKSIKDGVINFVKFLGKMFVGLGRLLARTGISVAYFVVLVSKSVALMSLRFWYFLKNSFLSIRLLFAGKNEDKRNNLLKKKEKNLKYINSVVATHKEKRQQLIDDKNKLHDKTKSEEKTQEDLDDVTKKDFIMKIIRMVMTYTVLTFTALFIFIPFYWMIITSLKTYTASSSSSNIELFIGLSDMQWINFKIALTEFNFLQYIGNTVFVGLTTMVFTVLTTILAAFAFSRLEFKGREFIFSLLLMTMMIPGELYTITNYITVSNLGWIDSFYALIVPFSASVFYIFFLRQSFRQIPDTLYRAAKVDGASDFKYLTRVMIPIAAPTIITIIILSSIGAWDAYIWPQLVSRTDATKLVSVALRNENFTVGSGSDQRPMYNLQLAATTIVTVPLLIVFFSLKKYILAGVGRSGTKG